jgi:hypothetical protein
MDNELAALASPRQLQILQALDVAGGSKRGAAKALGVDPKTIRDCLERLQAKADKQGVPVALAPVAASAPVIGPPTGKRVLVLPDVQAKDGTDFSFLKRIGQYAADKKPDIILCIGDFADMESLSSYDAGKKCYEGRRYSKDIAAAHEAMNAFLEPMADYNAAHPDEPYKPRMVMTLGNHENRINVAIEKDPKLAGTISVDDLEYESFGWEVYDFLEVVVIDGVAFSHFFVTGVMGRPAGTAAAQLRVANMSCFSGHQQGKQIAYAKRADGAILTSIISGSCYEHWEGFLGPQTNKQHWRGFFMLHDMHDGGFDEMPVSLSFVNQRYAHISVPRDYARHPQCVPA